MDTPGWDCKAGTPEEDHDWFYKTDWYGDPNVINGTADCSHWECRVCGEVDFERDPPTDDHEWLR